MSRAEQGGLTEHSTAQHVCCHGHVYRAVLALRRERAASLPEDVTDD